MRVIVLRTPDWPRTLRDDWRALFDADSAASPFQSWEWLSTWWRVYGRGRSPYIITAYEGDDLVGILPMLKTVGPWRTLRSLGVGPSDYLGPIAQPDLRDAVLRAFLSELREAPADMVDLHQWSDPVDHAAPIEQATCLKLDLPDQYESYIAGLSKSLRYDVRRLERTPELRVIEPEDPRAALDVLFDLHAQRWRSRGLPGAFTKRSQRFHEAWAVLAKDCGWLRLSTLEHEGSPIGALYAMAVHGRTYYYQAGFDPAASRLSPGTVLVAAAIRRAIEEGDTVFDFCRGDEPYKRRWKPQRVEQNHRFVFATTKGRGHIGERWNRMAWGLEARLRDHLEGGNLTLGRAKKPSESPAA